MKQWPQQKWKGKRRDIWITIMVLCVASVFLLITFVLVFAWTHTHTHILKTNVYESWDQLFGNGVVYQQIIFIWIKWEKPITKIRNDRICGKYKVYNSKCQY